MTKVLVTGSRGLLGATLMRVLPEMGFDTVVFEGDVRDRDVVDLAFYEHKIDWVVHCAAKTSVAECEKNPRLAFEVNTESCRSLVLAARPTGTKIIYISTASVFSGEVGGYLEDDTPEPIRVYDQSKREGELHVLDYDKGMVLRLNLIGLHPDIPRVKNFMEWLVDAFKSNRDVTLFDDVFINPLSNWSAARTIGTLIRDDCKDRVLHIGSRDVLSKAAIGKLVAARFQSYTGKIATGSVDAIGDGVKRPKLMWLDTHKAHQLLCIRMPMLGEEISKIFSRTPIS